VRFEIICIHCPKANPSRRIALAEQIALTERRRRLVGFSRILRELPTCGSQPRADIWKEAALQGRPPMTATPGRFSRYRQRAFELLPRRQLSVALEAALCWTLERLSDSVR